MGVYEKIKKNLDWWSAQRLDNVSDWVNSGPCNSFSMFPGSSVPGRGIQVVAERWHHPEPEREIKLSAGPSWQTAETIHDRGLEARNKTDKRTSSYGAVLKNPEMSGQSWFYINLASTTPGHCRTNFGYMRFPSRLALGQAVAWLGQAGKASWGHFRGSLSKASGEAWRGGMVYR